MTAKEPFTVGTHDIDADTTMTATTMVDTAQRRTRHGAKVVSMIDVRAHPYVENEKMLRDLTFVKRPACEIQHALNLDEVIGHVNTTGAYKSTPKTHHVCLEQPCYPSITKKDDATNATNRALALAKYTLAGVIVADEKCVINRDLKLDNCHIIETVDEVSGREETRAAINDFGTATINADEKLKFIQEKMRKHGLSPSKAKGSSSSSSSSAANANPQTPPKSKDINDVENERVLCH